VVLSLHPGGTERLVLELATRLDSDMSMRVCCLDDAGTWASALENRGVAVDALRRAPGFRPGLGRAIARIASHHEATVIHAHHYSPFVYACLAHLWRPRASVVFTEHGRLSDAPPSARRRAANRLLAKVPRRVFAVSGDLKQHLMGEGFRSDAVDVVYNGIDVGALPDVNARAHAREVLGASHDIIVIGTVARLDPVKDIGTLLRAAAHVVAIMSAMIVVIGDGPERSRLETLAVELGLEAHVLFLGHRDDARALLAGFDIYVNSSISEGVSLTILEAMAAGLPIVATRVGGTPEVVDETCGHLVPARTTEPLSSALVDLAQQAHVRRELGRAGRQRVEARFTLDRMVAAYRDVYASLSEDA
jgi:L-malate glycosyltransferase